MFKSKFDSCAYLRTGCTPLSPLVTDLQLTSMHLKLLRSSWFLFTRRLFVVWSFAAVSAYRAER